MFFSFCGSRAILSGPAAGVVGVSLTAYDSVCGTPIIGFDMGGTSTDVSFDKPKLHLKERLLIEICLG